MRWSARSSCPIAGGRTLRSRLLGDGPPDGHLAQPIAPSLQGDSDKQPKPKSGPIQAFSEA